MRHRLFAVTALVLFSMSLVSAHADDDALPLKGGRSVVATINGDAVFLDELLVQLDPPIDRARLQAGHGTLAELAVLDRLISSRLIALEAATMGIGDLVEVRKQVEVYSREALRETLFETFVKEITPDEKAIETAYRNLVREWKTTSLLFADEAAAKSVQAELAAGADFDTVSLRVSTEQKATAEHDDVFRAKKEYLPEIAAALATLEVNQVSPVIHIQKGFVVLRVVDVRYPENEAAREEATKTVTAKQQQQAIHLREEALRADLVVIHQTVLDALDYEAASIDTLLRDTRVLADIKGAKPVTVGDLTDYMRMQFFHGADETSQGKRLNMRKVAALDATIGRRLFNLEALRLGIDKTDAYLDRINAFEESLVFGAFVEKVILPENKMREEDVKAYYDQHLQEYSSPEMLRMRSLAFTGRAAAEDAIAKLRNGADFGWLASTAEGQVGKDTQGLLTFDGRPVTSTSLPDDMLKTLANPKGGDVRLYASPEGPFYLLSVEQVIRSDARPYEEVRSEIGKKLYGEKVMKGIEEYASKLRSVAKIETYLRKAE